MESIFKQPTIFLGQETIQHLSLTIIVSLAGQLYLTILIAILVGKYLNKKH